MPRKKKLRVIDPWGLIHNSFCELQERFRYMKTGRDYYNVVYFGSTEDLRTIATRILNALDTLEQVEHDKPIGE